MSEIWPCFKLVGLKKFIWYFGFFTLKKFPLQKNIYYSIFSATVLQSFCDKLDGRPHSDGSKI